MISKAFLKRLQFFEKSYSRPPEVSWMLEGLDLSPIIVESANWLDCPFVKKEGHKPVFQLGKAKVPNLKNFSMITFQECWDVIKENLL